MFMNLKKNNNKNLRLFSVSSQLTPEKGSIFSRM